MLEAGSELAGDERGPFEGDRSCQQELVAGASAAGTEELSAFDLADQDADEDRPLESERDLRVAADERDALLEAGISQLPEVGLHTLFGRSFR